MNWKAISFAMLGLGGIIYGLIDSAADHQLERDAAKKAVEAYDDATVNKLVDAQTVIESVDAITERERKEITAEINLWKKENNYDGRLRDIHEYAAKELNEFKQSINYFARKEEIEENAENALDIFKNSIDFDFEIDKLQDEIDTAKSAYKKRSKLYDLAGNGDDDVSDALSTVKKAEKDKMEATVKKSQDKINELKNKVSSEKTRIDRKKQSELRDLENELQATKSRIGKAEKEASDVVRKELSMADEGIRKAVTAKRTEKEIEQLNLYQESMDILEKQKQIDSSNALNIYTNTPKCEKWAQWFKANDCPRWLVAVIGLLPYIPAGYLVVKYTGFFIGTLKAMGKDS